MFLMRCIFIYRLNLSKGLNGTTAGVCGGIIFSKMSLVLGTGDVVCTKETVLANVDDIPHFGTLEATHLAVNKRKKTLGITHRRKPDFGILPNVDFS